MHNISNGHLDFVRYQNGKDSNYNTIDVYKILTTCLHNMIWMTCTLIY